MARGNKPTILSTQTLVPIGVIALIIGGVFFVANIFNDGKNTMETQRLQRVEYIEAINRERDERVLSDTTMRADIVLLQSNSKSIEITLTTLLTKFDSLATIVTQLVNKLDTK